MVGTEVVEVDADLGKIWRANQAFGIIVEEFDRNIERFENSRQIRQCCFFEVIVSKETDDVIKDKYAVDGGERFGLEMEPVDDEISHDVEQPVSLIGISVGGCEKFCRAEQKRGDVEGPT